MRACHIQYVLLLSLLGFFPCSDTLICQDGSMVKLGQNFSKAAIEWIVNTTVSETDDTVMCQETLLLIDVGKKSLILGSKGVSRAPNKTKNVHMFSAGPGIVAASYVHYCDTNKCNRATSTNVLLDNLLLSAYDEPGMTKCPICLDFRGSCDFNANITFCPKDTKCYASALGIQGGSLSTFFSIFGCLNSSYTFLLNNQSSIGTIGIRETLELNTSSSSSHVLVRSTLLAWMLGLRALLSLLSTEICPLS
ncbi:CD177 antigen-like [Mastomys coucha]|uniref:CD177 antigen-like n=1 Tax=Mastomys coucha TaxID=35658 RepID=UPI0012621255|nr:CD177 antigen-like [Mastomys coucha]